jgi:hypothetical protein
MDTERKRKSLGLLLFAIGLLMTGNVIICGPEAFGGGQVSVIGGVICGFVVTLCGLRIKSIAG